MTGKALRIELSAEQQALVQRQIDNGHFNSVDDVITEALQVLDEQSATFDDFLRAKVEASLANTKPNIPIDEVFKRLEAKHALRMKATKREA